MNTKNITAFLMAAVLIAGSTFFAGNLRAQSYWNLAGNSNTSGTTDCDPLILKTHNLARLFIGGQGGRIGLHITQPMATLHLHQPQPMEAACSGGTLYSTPLYSGLTTFQMTNTTTGSSGSSGLFFSLAGVNANFKLLEDGNFSLLASNNQGLRISPDGTVSLDNPLPWLTVDHTSSVDWEFGLHVLVDRALTKAFTVTRVDSGEIFRVMGNGTTYAKRLVAEEIRVSLSAPTIFSWPDFVFERDYKLLPLCDVEAFVKSRKHLPGIPSREEVAEEGVDLAAMNALLLQKIEELTLYLIELEKRINSLEGKEGGVR